MTGVQILNGRFDPYSTDETIEAVTQTIRAGDRGVLCTVNVAILMMMRSDPRLQRFVDAAQWAVADGQPLVWASRLGPKPLPERVTGVDLIDRLCARAARDGFGVYLLGANIGTVQKAADVLRARHRGLDIRGIADGYFSPEQAADRARAVAESGADLLFVAMGAPRQEYFILLRNTTERPEAVDAGTAQLVGTDVAKIVATSERLLTDAAHYRAIARARNPFGDGHASERILDVLAEVKRREPASHPGRLYEAVAAT